MLSTAQRPPNWKDWYSAVSGLVSNRIGKRLLGGLSSVEWSLRWVVYGVRVGVPGLAWFVATIAFAGTLLTLYQEIEGRRQQRLYQAWEIIHSADGQRVSGARIMALEDLNENGATLAGIRLDSVDLSGAQLRSADLMGASLRGSNLRNADLRGASLGFAHLEGATLQKAVLSGVFLRYAHLEGAKFFEPDLAGTNLNNSKLDSAQLFNADLRSADLHNASLKGTNLSGARMAGANLWYTKLDGASFVNAHIEGANFKDANWWDAIVSEDQEDWLSVNFPKPTPSDTVSRGQLLSE